jgi:hypothetical protein
VLPDKISYRGRSRRDPAAAAPGGLVIWGVYSRRFTAYPPFPVRHRVIIIAGYPQALIERMDEAERSLRIPEAGSDVTMSLTPDHAGDAHVRRARALTRQRVSQLLDGCALQIEERASGLVITNPRRPEQGRVHVAYADGYVCRERVTWEYWGLLEGFENSADDPEPVVGAATILGALAPDDIHHPNRTGAGFHTDHADGGQPVSLSAPDSDRGGPYPDSSEALRALAGQLESLGLAACLLTYLVAGADRPRFDALTARNPSALDRGVIYVKSDGLVTWECAGNLHEAGAILDDVTNVLRAAGPHFRAGRP